MSLFTYAFIRAIATALFLAHFSCAYPNITQELGPLLSPGAVIIFPGSTEFLVATDRDNEQDPPTYAVVVEVASESDVQETVSFCLRWIQPVAHHKIGTICDSPRHTLLGYDWLAWGNEDFRKLAAGAQYQNEETEFCYHCGRRWQR